MSVVDHVLEDMIHEALEGCQRIGESKEHDCRLVETTVGSESGLPLVTFLDADVVVTPPHVKFGEEARVLSFGNQFLDQRQRILVFDCSFVKLSIILDWSERAVMLLDEEEG